MSIGPPRRRTRPPSGNHHRSRVRDEVARRVRQSRVVPRRQTSFAL